jgi:hypothetical protein
MTTIESAATTTWCCAAHPVVPRSSAWSVRVTVPGWTCEASRSTSSTAPRRPSDPHASEPNTGLPTTGLSFAPQSRHPTRHPHFDDRQAT